MPLEAAQGCLYEFSRETARWFGWLRSLTILGLVVLVSGGCAGSPSASTPTVTTTATQTATVTASPTPSTAGGDGGKVESLDKLYELLKTTGLKCATYEVTIKNVSSDCEDGQVLLHFNGGSEKEARLFQASMFFAWNAIRDQDRQGEVAILVGPNWFIRIGLDDAETLRNEYRIGDTILH